MLNREIALAAILDRYGPLLTVENLATVLHLSPRSLRNSMCGKDALGLPRSRKSGNPQYFSAKDVAEWLFGKSQPPNPPRLLSMAHRKTTPNAAAPARRALDAFEPALPHISRTDSDVH